MIKNPKTRILYYYIRGAQAGGSDTCLYLLLKYLDTTKYDPIILYRDKSIFTEELNGLGFKLVQLPEFLRKIFYKKIKKFSINSKSINTKIEIKNNFKSELKLVLILRNIKYLITHLPQTIVCSYLILKHKASVIHANHDISSDHPMIFAGLILGRKVICHNRGLYTPMATDIKLSNYVEKIICMSDFSKSVYVKSGVNENKCVTIYDGINVNEFTPNKYLGDKPIISCIGRLETWKGQQVLVDAAKIITEKIPQIHFYLVGSGDNENYLKEKVNKLNLQDNFIFTGHITNVQDYINNSTIIVHTSIVPEPFGMVILEAMALEKVVIATNFGGPKEIITDGVDGYLVNPENPSELAEKISYLLNNSFLIEKVGKSARNTVKDKFDVCKFARQIEKFYN